VTRRSIVVAVVGIGVASLLAWAFVVRPALDTPERRVAAYLGATSSGNEGGALDAWVPYPSNVLLSDELRAQRTVLTHELSTLRVGGTYTVRSVDWWRTCCEPGLLDGERNAGLARMHVIASDRAGGEHRLVFEVWVKKLTWWGDAAGDTVKDWTLYEVHREGEPCHLAGQIFGC
jgi:hypothetical protein